MQYRSDPLMQNHTGVDIDVKATSKRGALRATLTSAADAQV
jgi:hypothetical protein